MVEAARVPVLMRRDKVERFLRCCQERVNRKSTLIVRLVPDHANREHFRSRRALLVGGRPGATA